MALLLQLFRDHFIREKVMNGDIEVQFCPSSENVADIFTKPLGRELFQKHCLKLGLKTHEEFLHLRESVEDA